MLLMLAYPVLHKSSLLELYNWTKCIIMPFITVPLSSFFQNNFLLDDTLLCTDKCLIVIYRYHKKKIGPSKLMTWRLSTFFNKYYYNSSKMSFFDIFVLSALLSRCLPHILSASSSHRNESDNFWSYNQLVKL